MQSAIFKESCSFAQRLRVTLQGMAGVCMGECPSVAHSTRDRCEDLTSRHRGLLLFRMQRANQAQTTGNRRQ